MDVRAEVWIAAPRERVAAYAMLPENDPAWIGGIESVSRLDDGPIGAGSRVARLAAFLGRRIEYVLEVIDYEFPVRMVMQSVQAPFPMRVTYQFDEDDRGTLARIGVSGDASGFYRLASPLLPAAVRRSLIRDLQRLRAIMESTDQSLVA